MDAAIEENKSENPFDRLSIMTASIAMACSLPFFLVFAILGDLGRGVAASISVTVILLVIWMRLDLKRRVWFWTTIAIWVLLHIPLILLVPWSGKSYPRVVLLPEMLLDFFIVYGSIGLVERVMRSGDGGNSRR
jgi:hypothetical protein